MSGDKQFNYRKLKNQEVGQTKPQRPPQPNTASSRESILIDVSPPDVDTVLRKKDNNSCQNSARAVSLLDEPIDVPQEEILQGKSQLKIFLLNLTVLKMLQVVTLKKGLRHPTKTRLLITTSPVLLKNLQTTRSTLLKCFQN